MVRPTSTGTFLVAADTQIRSLQEAIVVDGLDTTKLQIEPQGQLISAP